jgi:hypothetical protein
MMPQYQKLEKSTNIYIDIEAKLASIEPPVIIK